MDRVQPPLLAPAAGSQPAVVQAPAQEVIRMQSSFSIHTDSEAGREDSAEPDSSSQDKFAHTRGKRKRTGREDHQVLESEYQQNARPDKATRAAIVARVSLSEKEVQIWFQNRRQMTRRKCRTWQPNAITSIIRSSKEQNTSDDSNNQSDNPEETCSTTRASESAMSHERSQSHSEGSQLGFEAGKANRSQSLPQPPSRPTVADPCSEQESVTFKSQKDSIGPSGAWEGHDSHDASGNAWQCEYRRPENALRTTQRSSSEIHEQELGLKRKSSAIRLSLSFDGKAEVVLGGDSPSPPKKPALGENRVARIGPLERSWSAIDSAVYTDQPLGIDIPKWRRERAPGRSRDARTWEFYCDSDARNALIKTAEQDQKGSAQAVLGLIRSGSNARRPLTPIRQGNMPLQRSDSGTKKTAVGRVAARAKFGRSLSSLARLQTENKAEPTTKPTKPKPGEEIEVWQDNFGDSDKENNDPNDNGRSGAASNSPEPRVSCGWVLPSGRNLGNEDKENLGAEADGSDTSHLSVKNGRADDDLDAVQNLLRLSQGDWH